MKSGIFASGVTRNKNLQVNSEFPLLNLRWVAVRGGIHDWAIYYSSEDMDENYVARFGNKCYDPVVARELVHCDNEAFKMYRF